MPYLDIYDDDCLGLVPAPLPDGDLDLDTISFLS